MATRKTFEPVLGRMHPADPEVKKTSRTDIVGTYEQIPLPEPGKTDRLRELEGQQIRVRLREDLPAIVAEQFGPSAPYVARIFARHNRQKNITEYRHKYTFVPKQVREVGFEHGIALLTDPRHGTYLEEAPPVVEEDKFADFEPVDIERKILRERRKKKLKRPPAPRA